DHMPRGRKSEVFCTANTQKLMHKRGFSGTASTLEFGQPLETDHARITLYPAGHILGSAMVFVESDEGSVLYTGDCRIPPSPASEGFTLPEHPVDHLITEATFSLPIYKWDSHESLAREVRDFATTALEEDSTPVFLAYSLGKTQEIMQMLAPLGHTVQLQEDGYQLCKVYEQAGFHLGHYERYNPRTCRKAILMTSSHALRKGFAAHISRKHISYCSGWASHGSARGRQPVDKLIPLSDHLDFFELIDLCKKLNPQKVHITHTPNADVVQHYLDKLEIESRFLDLDTETDD
ncbi:MAG TPA: MBL fold metallo-hydrolase, partial [Fodinibius sp.]|nr:MBL fold metallo-hydrolase [Fodinibius sp.]